MSGQTSVSACACAKKDVNRKNVTRCRPAEEQIKYGNKVRMIA